PGAYVAARGSGLSATRAARQGLIYIQDEASQLVSLLVDPQPGERVLDVCAAPGSKSTHLSALSGGKATIVAGDIHPKRLAVLKASAAKLTASNLCGVAMDATGTFPFLPGVATFDRVLLDAPCSGTGTLRQNPEIKWRLNQEDVTRLASLQAVLLSNSAGMVRPGGRLVYSVCSMEREEAEDVVESFLGRNAGAEFRVVQPERFAPLTTGRGFVRTYPHLQGCDGFFAAILEKQL
ncbi:MAG: RsmB/NOP family class I SAM-dependent RNA methyltransferase, partial [Limisphaerales bacterium]